MARQDFGDLLAFLAIAREGRFTKATARLEHFHSGRPYPSWAK